jgi:hypothetical protein
MNFRSNCAFLDIETSWQRTITVIGVYRPLLGTTQLVAPRISRARLLETLNGVKVLYTYNGARFDLPIIETALGSDLTAIFRHRDLMHDCWRHGLKGGLKGVERLLGIHRDTEGLNGLDAMNLWQAYQGGDTEALEILLRYNREDVENLEILASKLGVTGISSTRRRGDRARQGRIGRTLRQVAASPAPRVRPEEVAL